MRSPVLAIAAAAALASCAPHGQSVHGEVFEVLNPEAPPQQWKRVASADAFVIVHWTGTVPGLHVSSVCLHAAIGKTDERGRFEVPGWWAAPKLYPVIPRDPAVMVYKPGFDTVSDFSRDMPAVRSLVPTKAAAELRAMVLSSYARAGCFNEETLQVNPLDDPQGVAQRFYRALYDEAQALGPLPAGSEHHRDAVRAKAGVPKPAQPVQIRVLPR